jgi:hypothetical protein
MRIAAKAVLALLALASCATSVCAQTIEIRLVNGKSGRPVANVCLSVWMTKDTRATATIRTNKNGIAQLRLTQKDNEVDISPNLKLGCGGDGAINPVFKYADSLSIYTAVDAPSCVFPENMPKARWKEIDPISTKEVLQHGVVSANTCGKVNRSPQPGEVILFVRSKNFGEKVEDWKNSDAFPF